MPVTSTTKYENVPFGVEVFDTERPNDPASKTVFCIGTPAFRRYYEEYTPNSGGGRNVWKSFEHYKCSAPSSPSLQEATITVDAPDNYLLHVGKLSSPYAFYNGAYGEAGLTNSGLPAFYAKRQDGGFVPPPTNLQDRINASLRSMMPVVKNELSLVNSLLELRDLASIPRSLKSIQGTIAQLSSQIMRSGRRSGNWRSATLRTLADSYLQYKFNIAPLVSDICGIYRVLTRTLSRINDYVSRAGKVRVQHFTVVLDTENEPIEPTVVKYPLGYVTRPEGGSYQTYTSVELERFVYAQAPTFHAQIQYNYNYAGYQREYARLLAVLDGLGVNLNPNIVWAAIPWSFVVDWVVGVGRYLNEQRVGWMDPQINILQYLWSVSRRRTIVTQARVTSGKYYAGSGMTGSYPPNSIVYPVVSETSYRRVAGLPDTSSFLTTSGLSSTELTLGAALVITNRKHQRSRG